MYACCVSSHNERGSFLEPETPPGSAALAMGSSVRTLLGDRSPSLGLLGLWPTSASLAVSASVASVALGTFLAGGFWAGGGPKEAELIRKQNLPTSRCVTCTTLHNCTPILPWR